MNNSCLANYIRSQRGDTTDPTSDDDLRWLLMRAARVIQRFDPHDDDCWPEFTSVFCEARDAGCNWCVLAFGTPLDGPGVRRHIHEPLSEYVVRAVALWRTYVDAYLRSTYAIEARFGESFDDWCDRILSETPQRNLTWYSVVAG